jgi:MSHA biogenesis protein MshP
MTRRLAVGRGHQGGFALVVAIFIVVVLALLGIMMVTLGGMERATASTATQGTRAYYAARSGIEWGAYHALASNCTAATGTFALSTAGLDGFTVNVQCAETSHKESGTTYRVVAITSTATYSSFGNSDYVSRTLQATVIGSP